jgi:hypothetical protein
MKLPRRTFLHLAAGAAALPAVSRIAFAQTYPSRPVRYVRCKSGRTFTNAPHTRVTRGEAVALFEISLFFNELVQ